MNTARAVRVLILLLGVPSFSLADDIEKKIDPHKLTDEAHWFWKPEQTSILYSILHFGLEYEIDLIRPPSDAHTDKRTIRVIDTHTDKMTIRVVKDGKIRFSWECEAHAAFVQKENILVYSVYDTGNDGCRLVGVDLDNGKEIWRTWLKGIGKRGHSVYFNSIMMHLVPDETVIVHGNEMSGRYIEIVDLKTGRTLANNTFPPLKNPHGNQ